MMTATLRKNVARYDSACIEARRRIDSQWLDKRLASMTPIADDRQTQFDAAKQSLAREFNIPANLI